MEVGQAARELERADAAEEVAVEDPGRARLLVLVEELCAERQRAEETVASSQNSGGAPKAKGSSAYILWSAVERKSLDAANHPSVDSKPDLSFITDESLAAAFQEYRKMLRS